MTFGPGFSGALNLGFSQGFAGIMGVVSGATLAQLVLLSPINLALNACATQTQWRGRVQKSTNFATEAILQPFSGPCAWGREAQATIGRVGDLLYWMYLILDLPAIAAIQLSSSDACRRGLWGPCPPPYPYPSVCNPCGDRPRQTCCGMYNDPLGSELDSFCDVNSQACTGMRGPWCNWVNSIGFAAIPRVAFSIGGQVIDTLFNHFMHAWEELSGKPGKRLEEMIGKRLTRQQLVADSQRNRRLYIPLPFYFTQHSGNALPLISLQYTPLMVHVSFQALFKLIQVSDCDVLPVKCRDGQAICDQDMNACIETTFVYLDMEERDRFALGTFNQLITYVQSFFVVSNSGCVRAQLNFNNPCLELIWMLQRQCQWDANNTFDYSGAYGCDPLEFCSLTVQGLPRFQREAPYFRLSQPWQCHTNIPKAFIYCYCFSLYPEEFDPTGAFNFTRVFNAELCCTLQEAIACTTNCLYVFCRAYNILHYGNGCGAKVFPS